MNEARECCVSHFKKPCRLSQAPSLCSSVPLPQYYTNLAPHSPTRLSTVGVTFISPLHLFWYHSSCRIPIKFYFIHTVFIFELIPPPTPWEFRRILSHAIN